MRSLVLLSCLLISSCSIFSVKDYQIVQQDAKTVATHNLSLLRYCNISNENYLYVNDQFDTNRRNLLVYINDINEDLARAKVCFDALEDYNLEIIESSQK